MKYKIPNKYKKMIIREFIDILLVEYEKIFNRNFINDLGYCELSTIGGSKAFDNTCNKLNLIELKKYRDSLSWDLSDLFDWEIEQLIIKTLKP